MMYGYSIKVSYTNEPKNSKVKPYCIFLLVLASTSCIKDDANTPKNDVEIPNKAPEHFTRKTLT